MHSTLVVTEPQKMKSLDYGIQHWQLCLLEVTSVMILILIPPVYFCLIEVKLRHPKIQN